MVMTKKENGVYMQEKEDWSLPCVSREMSMINEYHKYWYLFSLPFSYPINWWKVKSGHQQLLLRGIRKQRKAKPCVPTVLPFSSSTGFHSSISGSLHYLNKRRKFYYLFIKFLHRPSTEDHRAAYSIKTQKAISNQN